jgi:hypothetical protein
MPELLSFLERIGIPAGIALLVQLRIEPRLDALTKAIMELPSRMHWCACGNTPNPDATEPRS